MTDTERIIKVTLIGPESTGKTTLARELAQHYQTVWVPEYARMYQQKQGRFLGIDDVVPIAKGQLRLEKKYISKASQLLICDTDLLATKVYSEIYYGRCPAWVLQNLPSSYLGMYLLTNVDVPWVADGIRDMPTDRSSLYAKFKNELISRQMVFEEVEGLGAQRLQNAIQAVDRRRTDLQKIT